MPKVVSEGPEMPPEALRREIYATVGQLPAAALGEALRSLARLCRVCGRRMRIRTSGGGVAHYRCGVCGVTKVVSSHQPTRRRRAASSGSGP